MNESPTIAIITTCPDAKSAHVVADTLVKQNLAACVNIITGVTSVYRWQNQIEHSTEQLLLIKTVKANYTAVEQCILKVHPYELPEVISVPIDKGYAAYLSWIRENSRMAPETRDTTQ
ncbi:MAG: divalent-cation tolerance protein CutA [Gammaproteobacteria bacterium]|nr:divalent-cation tolerance protein CutA [Gammaproteobacteria bacterium]MDH5803238.1 divalent-cation tolerance protein CutA [Gammaproteobacteria bacterium]